MSKEIGKTLEEHIDFWHKTYNDTFDELQREKEKNKTLEKNNKIIAQIYRDDLPKDTEYIIITKPDFERTYKLEYISVDKIRAKIKELEKQCETELLTTWLEAKIEVLEDLLEE